jgi:hypothetical protein
MLRDPVIDERIIDTRSPQRAWIYWESDYVLNGAAIELNDPLSYNEPMVYLIYRARGTDEISRLGGVVRQGLLTVHS